MKTCLSTLLTYFIMACTHVQKPTIKAKVEDTVYTAVEISPSFPGGEAALGKFIQQNIKYPKINEMENFASRVFISFIVKKTAL